MAIENRDLAVGTRLVAKYKGKDYLATVVEDGAGKMHIRLEEGRAYKSLSAAGSAIMGGQACNGWRFWSVEKEETEPSEQPKAEGETESGLQPTDEAQTTTSISPPPKPKGKKRAKADAEPVVDCHCGTYEEGTESCKWRESGDCLEV